MENEELVRRLRDCCRKVLGSEESEIEIRFDDDKLIFCIFKPDGSWTSISRTYLYDFDVHEIERRLRDFKMKPRP